MAKKENWIGHVLRGEGLLKDVLEGGMFGKNWNCKSRTGVINDLKENLFVKMKGRADGREEWR